MKALDLLNNMNLVKVKFEVKVTRYCEKYVLKMSNYKDKDRRRAPLDYPCKTVLIKGRSNLQNS